MGLAPPEAGLVRAFVQLLAGDDAQFGWQFAADGPFDAVLADAALAARVASQMPGVPVCAVGGTPGAGAVAGHLARPLQRAGLAAWLRQVEGAGPARTAAAAPVQRPQAEAPRSTAPLYRLKRWPPAALLRNQPARVRMATLLGKRALSVDDLARMSGQTQQQCQVFVQLLQGFSLLEAQAPAAPSPRAAAAPSRAATPSAMLRVVRGLRLRLGLPQ